MIPTAPEVAELGTGPGRSLRDILRRIASAAALVGVYSVAVRIFMAGRDVALARTFGTADALDALVLAQSVPMFAAVVLAGAVPVALLPVYADARRNQGDQAARRLADNTFALTTAAAVVVAALLAIAAPLVFRGLASGFSADKLGLTIELFLLLVPVLVLSSASTVLAGILNAHHRFGVVAAAPMVTPLVVCGYLLASGRKGEAPTVALITTAAAVVEVGVVAMHLHRSGLLPSLRWHGLDEDVRRVLRQYVPAAGGAVLMTSTLLVDQAVAASRGAGAVATLNYGGKAVGFLAGIGSVSLATAVLPHFTAMVAEGRWAELRRTLRASSGLVAAASAPAVLILVVFARPIVRVVFEHGAFTTDDTEAVAGIQSLYLLQVPFYLIGSIGVRLLSALRLNQALMAIAAGNVVVNAGTDIAFLHLFGIKGIALSTSLVYLLSASAVYGTASRALRTRERTDARG